VVRSKVNLSSNRPKLTLSAQDFEESVRKSQGYARGRRVVGFTRSDVVVFQTSGSHLGTLSSRGELED